MCSWNCGSNARSLWPCGRVAWDGTLRVGGLPHMAVAASGQYRGIARPPSEIDRKKLLCFRTRPRASVQSVLACTWEWMTVDAQTPRIPAMPDGSSRWPCLMVMAASDGAPGHPRQNSAMPLPQQLLLFRSIRPPALLCSQTQTHCMPPATASGVRWPASSHSLTAVLPTHHPDRDTQTYISLATAPKSCPNEFRFDQSTTITKGSSSMNKENEPATAGTRSDRLT